MSNRRHRAKPLLGAAQLTTIFRDVNLRMDAGESAGIARAIALRLALVMHQGEVVASGPCAELFAAAAHDYTRSLLDAIPLPDLDPDWVARGVDEEHDQKKRRGEI